MAYLPYNLFNILSFNILKIILSRSYETFTEVLWGFQNQEPSFYIQKIHISLEKPKNETFFAVLSKSGFRTKI
jgi:hypothetical protein